MLRVIVAFAVGSAVAVYGVSYLAKHQEKTPAHMAHARRAAPVRKVAAADSALPRAVAPPLPRQYPWLSATQLVAMYIQNEVAADAALRGKRVAVEGVATKIGRDILDDAYVALGTNTPLTFRQVQAFFPPSREGQIVSFRPYQAVAMVCRVDGLMGNVLLKDCAVVDGWQLGENLLDGRPYQE
jgi:hypothetical protein